MNNLQPEKLHEQIFYYKNILSNPQKIVEEIESIDSMLTENDAIFKWKKWTASDDENYVFGYQKQTDSRRLPTSSDAVKDIYTTLRGALESAGRHYCSERNLPYFDPSPLSISKYIVGGSMGAHVDEYPNQPKEPIMSGVMYLNDDCVGGELDFPQQGIRIKPAAGSIVIFPSVKPFYHQSLEVTEGNKYMSPVFWIKNL